MVMRAKKIQNRGRDSFAAKPSVAIIQMMTMVKIDAPQNGHVEKFSRMNAPL